LLPITDISDELVNTMANQRCLQFHSKYHNYFFFCCQLLFELVLWTLSLVSQTDSIPHWLSLWWLNCYWLRCWWLFYRFSSTQNVSVELRHSYCPDVLGLASSTGHSDPSFLSSSRPNSWDYMACLMNRSSIRETMSPLDVLKSHS